MSDIRLIDTYLLKQMAPEEHLLMDAKLLLDQELRNTCEWQSYTYALVKLHARQALKQELEAVHEKLFSEKKFESFREKIKRIFHY